VPAGQFGGLLDPPVAFDAPSEPAQQVAHALAVLRREVGDLLEAGDAGLVQQSLDHRADALDALQVVGDAGILSRPGQEGFKLGDASITLREVRPASAPQRSQILGERIQAGAGGGEAVGHVLQGGQAASTFGQKAVPGGQRFQRGDQPLLGRAGRSPPAGGAVEIVELFQRALSVPPGGV